MTRLERKKIKYEELCQKETEKLKIVMTSDNIYENCLTCEYCKKYQLSEQKEIYKCLLKARKDLSITKDIFTNEIKSKTIGFYAYGEINGKCPNFVVMRMMSEFE